MPISDVSMGALRKEGASSPHLNRQLEMLRAA